MSWLHWSAGMTAIAAGVLFGLWVLYPIRYPHDEEEDREP